jgi:hypothetical protein
MKMVEDYEAIRETGRHEWISEFEKKYGLVKEPWLLQSLA